MRLFGRDKPLHQQLAERGGLASSFDAERPRAPAAQPPGWDGEPRGEPGVHGVPRTRRWDVVTTVDVPELKGDSVMFVALPDSSLIRTDDEAVEAVEALADAVEERLPPPFRAEAVRRGETRWAVAAAQIATVEAPGLRGDTAELVSSREGTTLHIDGRPSFGSAPALERAGEVVGAEYVVRAKRLEGDFWEVDVSAL